MSISIGTIVIVTRGQALDKETKLKERQKKENTCGNFASLPKQSSVPFRNFFFFKVTIQSFPTHFSENNCIFISCRIELIFSRWSCLDMKNIFPGLFLLICASFSRNKVCKKLIVFQFLVSLDVLSRLIENNYKGTPFCEAADLRSPGFQAGQSVTLSVTG